MKQTLYRIACTVSALLLTSLCTLILSILLHTHAFHRLLCALLSFFCASLF